MAFLDTVRDNLKPDETKAREQLDVLKRAAKGELESYRTALVHKMRNPDAFKEEIVPYKMFENIEQYRVDLTEGASDEIAGIVDSFFTGTEQGVKDGFSAMIKFAFKAVLGSSATGETSTRNWYITLEHGALIRVDVMAWRYNFSGEGVIASVKNAFCFTTTKSFVDTSELRKSELRYFVARSLELKSVEQLLENETLKKYVELLEQDYRPRSVYTAMKEYEQRSGRRLTI